MRGRDGHYRWDSHPIFWFLESGGKRIRGRIDLLRTAEWWSNDAKLDFDRAAPVPLAVKTGSKPSALAAHLKRLPRQAIRILGSALSFGADQAGTLKLFESEKRYSVM